MVVLEFPSDAGLNIFSNTAIYNAKKATIRGMMDELIDKFISAHGVGPTTIYLHGSEAGILRSVCKELREQYKENNDCFYQAMVPDYTEFTYRAVRIKEGCSMKQGTAILIFWGNGDASEASG